MNLIKIDYLIASIARIAQYTYENKTWRSNRYEC